MDTDINEKLANLLIDSDFEMLELSLNEPNIFHALSDERKELKHSNFLAYLLNPNESHGLNEIFLKRIIRDFFSESKDTDTTVFDIEDINLSTAIIQREWKNIDLLINFDTDVICIENKINITDSKNQLKKYRTIIDEHFPNKRKHFVYLSPFGQDPNDQSEIEYYQNYSYVKIVENISSIIDVYRERINQKTLMYLTDYIQSLRRYVLMEEDLNKVALNLYIKHADAIEFIYNNKPDPASDLYPFFEKELKNRGYVIASKNKGFIRFTTKNLDKNILKTGTGWSNKESFLFEIDYFWSDKNAVFKAIVSPCDEEIKKKIKEAVTGKTYYKKPKGEKWLVFSTISKPFCASEIVNEETEHIIEKIKLIIDNIEPTCKQISKDLEEIVF